MKELEKIAYAKSFIDKLSLGIDPTTGQSVSRDDVVFNPRISKCLSYVSNILDLLVKYNGRLPAQYRVQREKFQLPAENRNKFRFSDSPIAISEFCERVSELANLTVCRKLSYSKVTDWLVQIGLLQIVTISSDTDQKIKTKKYPTDLGKEMGIGIETRNGKNGPYTVVIYNRNMQEFMFDNIDDIIAFSHERQNKDSQL